MLPELTNDEISAALDEVAAEALERAGWTKPPVDAMSVARALELTVAVDAGQPGRARFVRLQGHAGSPPRGSILLRPDPRPERLQWSICHELGEYLALHVFRRLGVDPREAPPPARESVANQLAGRLLLPRHCFHRDALRLGWNLLALKRCYATASHELIARRMLDFALPIVITIFDQGGTTFRRGNAGRRVPPATQLERKCWQRAHETSRPQTAADRLQTVHAWPIHEESWKREILRTLIDVDVDDEPPAADQVEG